ncbi:MBL fold metallo-hydrolase [Hydrogenophaga sp.]|uniref:MBL fold metallo-hydrolase n=1 Tax=Hydrogenophaga sp. TaxID=1904254 RepID=UPI003522B87D
MPMSTEHDTNAVTSLLAAQGITVLERGWLSSNNVLLLGDGPTALVDSGYCSHVEQTIQLVQGALEGRPLDLLLNTHLHSDHCGGNAGLQGLFPALKTWIPPGQAAAVASWDPVALTYEPTGQSCPKFKHDGMVKPGQLVQLGQNQWEVHAAKGHDPHSVVLFQRESRILISADALWENGFGIVFPELEGIDAFDDVSNTLDLIEELAPSIIVPGHGAVFVDVYFALGRARSRLDQFANNPGKHRRHALKVLIKFKLLEWQSVTFENLLAWYLNTPYIATIEEREHTTKAHLVRASLQTLLNELHNSQALRIESGHIYNA